MSPAVAPHAKRPGASPTEGSLTDDDLRSEIEMVSELVVAATSSDGPMSQDEVDLLLGVDVVDVKVAEPAGELDS